MRTTDKLITTVLWKNNATTKLYRFDFYILRSKRAETMFWPLFEQSGVNLVGSSEEIEMTGRKVVELKLEPYTEARTMTAR